MSKPIDEKWHVEKRGGRIEIKMQGSSIALADTSENMELATFIAAAPDMYKWIELTVELAKGWSKSEGITPPMYKALTACSDSGRLFLKKARGEK